MMYAFKVQMEWLLLLSAILSAESFSNQLRCSVILLRWHLIIRHWRKLDAIRARNAFTATENLTRLAMETEIFEQNQTSQKFYNRRYLSSRTSPSAIGDAAWSSYGAHYLGTTQRIVYVHSLANATGGSRRISKHLWVSKEEALQLVSGGKITPSMPNPEELHSVTTEKDLPWPLIDMTGMDSNTRTAFPGIKYLNGMAHPTWNSGKRFSWEAKMGKSTVSMKSKSMPWLPKCFVSISCGRAIDTNELW